VAFPQASRFALFLRRAFSIKETMGDVNVLQDFFPTIELLGDVIPDQRRNRGEITWINGLTAPNIAANFSGVIWGFSNQTTPNNVVSVIRHLLVQFGAGANVRFGWTGFAPTNGFTNVVSSDGREPGALSSGRPTNPLQVGFNQTASTSVQSAMVTGWSAPSNAFLFKDLDVTLVNVSPDGNARNFIVEADTLNVSVSVVAIGYSRIVEPSERAV
jgi:hypothetical protein